MIYKVREFITKRKLFSKEDVLLLAISGGPDSVCLFFILKELGYSEDEIINLVNSNISGMR